MVTKEQLDAARNRLIYLQGQRDMTQQEVNNLLTESEQLKLKIEVLEETNNFFIATLNDRVNEVKHKVEDLINQGLSYVYNDPDTLIQIETAFKNNKTQFIISLKNGQFNSVKLTESFGGGLIAIIAFLFKVVINLIYKNEKFMVFDETLNFVSRHYQAPLSRFIKQLCDDLDVTIVLITHQPLLADEAHSAYEAYVDADGSTKFKLHETRDNERALLESESSPAG